MDISGKFDMEFIGGKQVVYSSMHSGERIEHAQALWRILKECVNQAIL
jgi:hypothetical protein